MKSYFVKGLLQNQGWLENVSITVDENGNISSIEEGKTAGAVQLNGYALPGFQNAHSHGFQYAMAGLAEIHDMSSTPDDFWSWRDAMYKLALSVSPDQMEAIAAMLYTEMLRHGYTNVAEFHYVHHDKNGQQYANLSEMGERMVAAAKKTGMNITLVPIFYQKGGFGKDPVEGQRRFISRDIAAYTKLLEASEISCKNYSGANIGIGIHSMRGVDPKVIAEIAKSGRQDIPFHIHISEQLKEIEDSINYLGKRPVEWMLDNVEMTDRFHLVHATHLTDEEVQGIAKSKANVVICPTTEGNLGDGIFPLRRFQELAGQWSIGTDSHIGLNPLEELRLLDYGQRLISHKRNTFTSSNQGDSGLFAYDMALKAGRKAMNNFETDYFKVGEPFNAAVLKANSPLIEVSSIDKVASTLLYSSDASSQLATISKGELVVENGSHKNYESIKSDFASTMMQLGSRN
jgi:formimidoylglutamate deiminase